MIHTAGEQAPLPSDRDVDLYRERGWYRSPRIVPDGLINTALLGVERHFSGERDWSLPTTSGFSDWKPGDEGLRSAEVIALRNRQLRELVSFPLLASIAARLSGSQQIRYFADTLIYKPPEDPNSVSVVGWHTDRAYWQTCTSEDMLTAWIPFQDTPAEMGPVMYVEGSHRWQGTDSMRTFRAQDLSQLQALFSEHLPIVKRPMTLQRGEVSFHHSRLLHGSEPNRSGAPRIALALHLQPMENRYRVHRNEQGVPWHIFNDDLARKLADGTPDYADPAVFPLLWPVDDRS